MSQDSRNQTLDAFKAIASFFIVMIHFNNVSGGWYDYYTFITNGFARFAVPLFFMISGYFIPALHSSNRFKQYHKKIIILTVIATILYSIYYLISSVIDGNSCLITRNQIIFWLFFNECPVGAHLWYFYALIYSLFIVDIGLIIGKKAHVYKYSKRIIRLSIFLLLPFVLYAEYSNTIFVRNFILGLVCILIGVEINRFSKLQISINSSWLYIAFLLSISELILIGYIYGVEHRQNIYITSIIFSAIVLVCSFDKCNILHDSTLLGRAGKRHSTQIFILHPLIADVLLRIFITQSKIYLILFPFIVYIASLIMSILYLKARHIYVYKAMAR